MGDIILEKIVKKYPDGHVAIKGIDLEVKAGEFIILVGASGCGKSTVLNLIAGLENITSGNLYIDGQLMNNVKPENRDIAMIFQSYALYPHLTVKENLMFPLKIRKVPKKEIDNKVNTIADMLNISEYLNFKPALLSGGQRQRVAMGRAIVRNPKIFLMDEPLSNLDGRLRLKMRVYLSRLQKRLNATTLYVTHDETEAMTLGDRIVILHDGIVQQIDTPHNIYHKPINLYVAGFIGLLPMNFMYVSIENNKLKSVLGDIDINNNLLKKINNINSNAKEFIMGIRPEHFEDSSLVDNNIDNGSTFKIKVDIVEVLGHDIYAHCILDEDENVLHKLRATNIKLDNVSLSRKTVEIICRFNSKSSIREGDIINVYCNFDHIYLFDIKTEQNIML